MKTTISNRKKTWTKRTEKISNTNLLKVTSIKVREQIEEISKEDWEVINFISKG